MKKIISALAVAAALGTAASAQAYEFQAGEDTTLSIYGNLQYIYIDQETAIDTDDDGDADTVDSRSQLTDNGSTIGLAGEHEWDNGLTAYFRAEWEFLADEKSGAGTTLETAAGDTVSLTGASGIQATDEAYGGLKGGFGDVRIGTWDGLFEDYISDPLNPFEFGMSEFNEIPDEPGDSIAYWTPSLGGLTLAVQGFFKGDGEEGSGGDSDQAFSALASYSADIFTVNLGYTDNGLTEDADGNIGLTGIVDLAPFTLVALVEKVGEGAQLGADGGLVYGVLGTFDYGPGAINAAVRQVEPDDDDDDIDGQTQFLANVTYSIVENVYVYGEVGFFDAETDVGDYTAVGAVWLF